MRIAIVGGGASGMAAAYLLHQTHAVTVLEKQPILGGNIRTVNKNVKGTILPSDVVLDNGVIEFLADRSPRFNALMADLEVELGYAPSVSTQLFLDDGRFWQAPGVIRDSGSSLVGRIKGYAKLLQLVRDYPPLQWKLRAANHQAFQGQPVSAFFGNSIGHRWLKMLLMYSYSIPYQKIEQFPAEFAAFILQDAGIGTRWNRIVGGVYTYIDKILARFTGEVHCNVQIVDIARKPDGVLIKLQSGESLAFDKVVFATPPDQVLDLLSDPNDDEKRRFAPWRANRVTTVIHTDTSLYRSYGVRHYSEFDVFEKDGGRDAGYNAYLNQLCGLSDQDTAYQMAYNLTERIDSKKIVHTQDHNTPLYTAEAIRYRHEVAGTNGENHTYHAGAYLGNGLHEGAISSAVAVSKLLGGHLLW